MKNKQLLMIIGIIVLVAAVLIIDNPQEKTSNGKAVGNDGTTIDPLVAPNKIISGGPPKDGIPSIDNPKFVSVTEADTWIEEDELVLALEYKEVQRVYPLQILVFHEIVNDIVAEDPILITYCPLCGSGIAYRGELDGQRVEFGTTGKLYNSNLVMYDRNKEKDPQKETYWTQIDGQAIQGPRTGEKLTPISIDTVVWKEWKEANPESEVLSKETGHIRRYGQDPYGGYYENDNVWFPLENTDRSSVHPKTVIFGIEVRGVYRAYDEADLVEKGTINDVVNGVNIEVTRRDDGLVRIMNVDTGEEIVKERDFWFAWYAFHPETTLYGFEEN